MNRIEKYYDQHPAKEKTRLTRSAYDSIESEITKRYFSKYIPAKSRIAEVGCGAGHYSVWLLEKNHRVQLMDLSSELLKLAQDEVRTRDLAHNVIGISKLDARNLVGMADSEFDVTLVMGPLYHLLTPEDRLQCMKEAYRITKPGGLIFSAIINRMCPFMNMMHESPETLVHELSEDTEEMNRIISKGQYENFEENPSAFTDAYFSEIEEIPRLYEELKIELLESFSCEGLASYMYDKAEIIKKNPKAWSRFLDILYENSNRPELLGASEHVVFIGKKL